MITQISPSTLTPDALLEMSEGDRFELVDGQLVERNSSGLSSLVGSRINGRLWSFVRERGLGMVFQSDCGYQCFPDDGKIRRPDGSFIRAGRLSLEELQRGYLRVASDLVVEVVSPNDLAIEVDTKVEEYISAGVR